VPTEWRRASISEKMETKVSEAKAVPREWRRASVHNPSANDVESLVEGGKLRARSLQKNEAFESSKRQVTAKMGGMEVPDGWVGLKGLSNTSELSRNSEASFADDDAKGVDVRESSTRSIGSSGGEAKGDAGMTVESNPYMMN
jgi:hypothetical protein